jgi:protein-tyrosine phosphatase
MSDYLRSDADRFNILFVCTANIHRSAMAERLLLWRLAPDASVNVWSAGVRARDGSPMGTNSASALRKLGAESGGHRARLLRIADVLRADLILTLEANHRQEILREAPKAIRRVFTLKEFSRLSVPAAVGGGPSVSQSPWCREELVSQVQTIAARRGRVPPPNGSEDIADPVGRSSQFTMQCAREILVHIEDVAHALQLELR